MISAKKKIIIALDVDNAYKAVELVDKLRNDVAFFKIGLELFSSAGPMIIDAIKERGVDVFLDLKFHDIPNTVMRAAQSVTKLGAYMFNVHALGGLDMMTKTAVAVREEAVRLGIERPKVIAVTILTSMDGGALKKIGVDVSLGDEVAALARLAKDAGLDGVVASPHEIKRLRAECGKDFLIVTPGVRPAWAATNDQKRIATPSEAISDGANFIVIGRPVTGAVDPVEAVRTIIKEVEDG